MRSGPRQKIATASGLTFGETAPPETSGLEQSESEAEPYVYAEDNGRTAATGKTEKEFKTMRPNLHALGFLQPVRGLGETWSIMDVINGVNNTHGEEHAAA